MPTYTLEQQKAHRAELVTALRSGRFTQTEGELHNTQGYCCLGVGSEVSGLGNWAEIPSMTHSHSYQFLSGTDEIESTVLTESVVHYYGFVNENGGMFEAEISEGEFRRVALTELNDDYHWTFSEIADIIEAEPHGMFRESL